MATRVSNKSSALHKTGREEHSATFPVAQKRFAYIPPLVKRPCKKQKIESSPPSEPKPTEFLLPEQTGDHKGKKTLIIDLDETLVHSSLQFTDNCTFVIPIVLDTVEYNAFVNVRPYAREVLKELSKFYEVVIFTASLKQYAETIIYFLDPDRNILRLYRDACVRKETYFVKDLTKLGRDLTKTLIVDNSPDCIELQPENGILVSSWTNDPTDMELLHLHGVLTEDKFLFSEDVTATLKEVGGN